MEARRGVWLNSIMVAAPLSLWLLVEPAHPPARGLAATGALDDGVCMTGINDAAVRAQAVTVDIGFRAPVAPRPVGQCHQGEASSGVITACRGWPSSETSTAITKGTLFSEPRLALPPLRSPTRHASSTRTMPPSWRPASRSLMAGMTFVTFVLEAPSGAVAHAQMAHQLQRSHVGLAPDQKIERQESARQRQLGSANGVSEIKLVWY